ncbi:D-glycero-beta-D-manno-heptose 1-phosphate adenylyltransferase [Candidatus Poribacteria bacterium]|jgi:rfaE bifunctional protein nucleotidyltransferase chain/domain|nr:D-glycero-beta-D-manno-heptose 1-phosphate adenylyltransferase [Candidatus Poribacteria bacterium]MBT5535675.1 D-glycero-beta-D-manno-heptose 1-phosphate adenylyltransferase [Candidatus Poribacteria bacterium]MBT5713373.1 D-glycero-beta-D-manno-heptose 1-phosphate adenylyltransferase [Candidatus Poribacteria bacterium]MBT7100294.1 D-glycero-beta-D-manno-heptose 1-phosphate adenylyltransferase [Candidatus Poribacteria bacterium]MBT7808793.1 D-glycero-beta-D-manno-heptose 1-phosphate adenylylt
MSAHPGVLPREEIARIARRERDAGRVVVTTNGCFDVLHVGHARYLQQARALGDMLIVGVNADDSVRKLKGPERPVIPEDERAEMLASLEAVDYVTIFGEDTPCDLLELIRPSIHVKGGDYSLDRVIEREVVERNGGEVVVGIHIPARSTTDIVQRIRELDRRGEVAHGS